ncbi:MAG: putative T4-like protein proximal tail fiber, partial [candidate division TM6 bacterium GW2011_GWF2_43_87]
TLTMNTSDDVSAITDSGIIYTNKYAAGMPSVSFFDRINLAFNYYDITNPSTPVIPNSGYGTSMITLGGDTTAGAGGAIVLGTSATNNTGPTARMAIRQNGNVELYNNLSLAAGTVVTEGGTLYIHHTGPTPATNIFVGDNAGNLTLTGGNNTGCGVGALLNLAAVSGGTGNTAFGRAALQNTTTGTSNTGVGSGALSAVTTGANNIGIGYNAGSGYNTSETNNICIGATVAGTLTESNVIRFGNLSHTATYITGISTTNVGATGDLVGITTGHQLGTSATTWNLTGNLSATGSALFTNAAVPTDLRLIGNSAGTASDWSILAGYNSSIDNISILEQGVDTQLMIRAGGKIALGRGVKPDSTYWLKVASAHEGYGSIMLGDVTTGNGILQTVSGATDYLQIGFTGTGSQLDTLRVTRTGDLSINASTIIYRDATTPYIHHTGPTSPVLNIFVGDNAGNVSVSGGNNTGCGVGALFNLSSGSENTACGRAALQGLTTGYDNTAVGSNALIAATTGYANTAIGRGALANLTVAIHQTAVGYNALQNYAPEIVVPPFWGNTAIGSNTLSGGCGQGNICIGHNAGSSGVGDFNIYIGTAYAYFPVGESNAIRIGSGDATNAVYINGVWLQSCDFGNFAYCNSDNKIGSPASSIRFKENIQEIPANKRASDLHPISFNYKASVTKELWYGLIAEEVEPIMPELVIKDSENLPIAIKYQHIPILLLKEVKELRAVIADLQARIAALESRV